MPLSPFEECVDEVDEDEALVAGLGAAVVPDDATEDICPDLGPDARQPHQGHDRLGVTRGGAGQQQARPEGSRRPGAVSDLCCCRAQHGRGCGAQAPQRDGHEAVVDVLGLEELCNGGDGLQQQHAGAPVVAGDSVHLHHGRKEGLEDAVPLRLCRHRKGGQALPASGKREGIDPCPLQTKAHWSRGRSVRSRAAHRDAGTRGLAARCASRARSLLPLHAAQEARLSL